MSYPETVDEILDVSEDEGKVSGDELRRGSRRLPLVSLGTDPGWAYKHTLKLGTPASYKHCLLTE